MINKILINTLFAIGSIQFGSFTFKSGMQSPMYIDLRRIISYPETLTTISELMWEKIKNNDFDAICGVPYTALPIATVISINHNKPMLMRRKEKKEYGTKQKIEGIFVPGQIVIVIEDLVTTGGSTLETIVDLEKVGLIVTDVVICVDRQQGGKQRLEKMGYKVHALLTIKEITTHLLKHKQINQEQYDLTTKFTKENQISL